VCCGLGEVPPKTLSEAGTLSICMSKAWKNKIVTSAWWVYDHQVRKKKPDNLAFERKFTEILTF